MQHRSPPPPAIPAEPTFSITDLAREFGITARAIRHYEEQGLLAPRRVGQQRLYSRRDRTRLKLTLRGRRLGLSLAEIKELLDMYDTAPESTQLVRFLEVLASRRARLEQQREDIEAVLREIDQLERQCRDLLAQEAPMRRVVDVNVNVNIESSRRE